MKKTIMFNYTTYQCVYIKFKRKRKEIKEGFFWVDQQGLTNLANMNHKGFSKLIYKMPQEFLIDPRNVGWSDLNNHDFIKNNCIKTSRKNILILDKNKEKKILLKDFFRV